MKVLISFCVLLFSLSGLAQTQIVVTPQRPVSCQLENHRNVNWIYEIEKLEETEEEAVFQFKTQHGYCLDGRQVSYQVDPKWTLVGLLADGMQWPWQKDAYEARVFGSTQVEVIVVLRFDKQRLFKKRLERHFDMGFYPYGYTGNYRYGWNVDVSLSPANETVFTIR